MGDRKEDDDKVSKLRDSDGGGGGRDDDVDNDKNFLAKYKNVCAVKD